MKVWTLPRIKVKKNSKRYNYNSTFSSLSVVLTYSCAHTPNWITVSSGSLTCIWSTMGVFFFFFSFSFFLSCVLLINHSINSFCFMSVHIEVILDPKRTHRIIIYTNFPTGLWTIDLTITSDNISIIQNLSYVVVSHIHFSEITVVIGHSVLTDIFYKRMSHSVNI